MSTDAIVPAPSLAQAMSHKAVIFFQHRIVGYYRAKGGTNRAFHWNSSRGKIDLPALRGQAGAQAHGINDSGEVVGYGWSGTGQSIAYHGIVWTGIR